MGIDEAIEQYKAVRRKEQVPTFEDEFMKQYTRQFQQQIAPGDVTVENEIIDQVTDRLYNELLREKIRHMVERAWIRQVANASGLYVASRKYSAKEKPQEEIYEDITLSLRSDVSSLADDDFSQSECYKDARAMLREFLSER